MNLIVTIILTVQLLSALAMIGLILLQHGKGADMGAAFGSGASGSLFGASGGANFLSRTTAVLATVFFVCTLLLAHFGHSRPAETNSVLDSVPATTAPAKPSPASQIPGTSTSEVPTSAPASAPTPAPAGPAQIPTR